MTLPSSRRSAAKFLKIISVLVISVFVLSTVSWSAPLALPSPNFHPKQISIPEELGSIQEYFVSDKGAQKSEQRLVVYIQDAHANPRAQKSILAILQHLSRKYGLTQIGVEGADSPINPTLLEVLPDKAINLKTAKMLLGEGRLSGTELFALETQGKSSVMGVDDRNLYRRNLEDYRRISDESSKIQATLERWKQILREQKRFIYDERLRELETRKENSSRMTSSTFSYISYLAKLADKILDVRCDDPDTQLRFPNMIRFLSLWQSQKNLDQKSLGKEIDALKQGLEKALRPGAEKEFLLKHLKAVDFPKGPRHYFEKLYLATKQTGISWDDYPHYRNRAASLMLEKELAGPRLFAELDQIEKQIYGKLLVSDQAKSLFVQSEMLDLVIRTIQLEATRQDISTLKDVVNTISLREIFKGMDFADSLELGQVENLLNESLQFYEVAAKRDESFISKLTGIMSSKNLSRMVLVTGGFHREGVTRLLREKGFSYYVVSPEIQGQEESRYRQLMTERKMASRSLQEAEAVDLAKVGAQVFLDRPGSLVDWLLRNVTLGTALALEGSGIQGVSEWENRVNDRLARWLVSRGNSRGGVSRVELEGITPWSRDMVELLFRITTRDRVFWLSSGVHRDQSTGDLSVSIKGPYPVIVANSLGEEEAAYGSRVPVTLKPARVAIILGGPRYLQRPRMGGPRYVVDAATMRYDIASNIREIAYSELYASYNRLFDALLRNLVGNPDIEVTAIFGVDNPHALLNLVKGNAFHGKFPSHQIKIETIEGADYLVITQLGSDQEAISTRIRIHQDFPNTYGINQSNPDYLLDFTNIDQTGEPRQLQQERLRELQRLHGVKKIFVINPQWDFSEPGEDSLVMGHNDASVLKPNTPQVVSFATPVTQATAHILSLFEGKLKEDIDYLADVTVRTINQRGDRELHHIVNHGMGSVLYKLFPAFAPLERNGKPVIKDGGEISDEELEALNMEAPFKGASMVSVLINLRDKAKIITDLKAAQEELSKKEKEAKKKSEAVKKIEYEIKEAIRSGEEAQKALDEAKLEAKKAKTEAEAAKGAQDELKKKIVKGLNEIFKDAATKNPDLKGIVRYASKDEYLNSLKELAERSLVVLDSAATVVTSGGQISLKFWVSDIGQGQALAETIKRAALKDQGELTPDQKAKLLAVQREFLERGIRSGTNVIPAGVVPKFKLFLLPGEKRIKAVIQGGRGRIGKFVQRIIWDDPNYRLHAINGVEETANLVQQLNVDEVHGPYPFIARQKTVKVIEDGKEKEKGIDVIYFINRETRQPIMDPEDPTKIYEVPVFNIRVDEPGILREMMKKKADLDELSAQLQKASDSEASRPLQAQIADKRYEISSLEAELAKFRGDIIKIVTGAETVINASSFVDFYIDNTFNKALGEAGVRRDILTGPKKASDKEKEKVHASVLWVVNNGAIDPIVQDPNIKPAVISCVSCTTQGMGGPLAEFLETKRPSVLGAYFLTEHGFTVSQGALFGAPRSGKELTTANGPDVSLLPSTSGANKAFVEALPWMKGKLEGESTRIANPDGSLVRTFIKMKFDKAEDIPTIDQINEFFRKLVEERFPGVFGYEAIENTSQLLGRRESSIVDPRLTQVIRGKDSVTVIIGEWYDNEGGFTQRVWDTERYAAMVSRGIDPKTGLRKELPSLVSAVKLPGHQRLRMGSREHQEILAGISQKSQERVSLTKLAKRIVGLFRDRRVPGVLKGQESENFNKLNKILEAISNEVNPGEPVVNPYVPGREVRDIEIRLVDLGDETSVRTSGGDRYFGVSQYLENEKKLRLYFPQKFFSNHFVDLEEDAVVIQLVLMFLFQETLGLSYPESLIAIANYNSRATRKAADGNTTIPDLLRAMLDEVKKKSMEGDAEAIRYLNACLNSEVSFVVSDEIRKALESHGRTPADIQAIQAELSRMALLINDYVTLPLGLKLVRDPRGGWEMDLNPMPAGDPSLVAPMNDDLATEPPTKEMLSEASVSRLVAVTNALAPRVFGYQGASARVTDGDQRKTTERLLEGLPVSETSAILEACDGQTEIVSYGGPVHDLARPRFSAGDVRGRGPKKGYLMLNPLERKAAVLGDRPGALSVALHADSKEALGGELPPFYMNAFIGSISGECPPDAISRIREDLEQHPINPDDNPVQLIQRWMSLNGKSAQDVVVHVLDVVEHRKHETERIGQLEAFQKTDEGRGMVINRIEAGTFEGALKAAWGDPSGKLHIFLSTSGAAEVQAVMVMSGRGHTYGRAEVMSRRGLSEATDIRPEHAHGFHPDEEELLRTQFPGVKDHKYTFGIIGQDVRGDFEASVVAITRNEMFGLERIRKAGDRVFEVDVLRVVRKGPDHLYRWVERWRGELDVVTGIRWTQLQATSPVPDAAANGNSLGTPLEQARGILLESGMDERTADQIVGQGVQSDFSLGPSDLVNFTRIFQPSAVPFGGSAYQVLSDYAQAHEGSFFTALFSTEKPNLGVTVTTTSVASPEGVVTRLLADKGGIAVVVQDQEGESLAPYSQLIEKLKLSPEGKEQLAARLLLVEPMSFDPVHIKALLANILAGGKFMTQAGKLVTLGKIASGFSRLAQGAKIDGYLKQHTVALAPRQFLPDPDRVPGMQLISVERDKLDASSWPKYRLLASGVAMKLAHAGKFDLLPYEVRVALEPKGENQFAFRDNFVALMNSLWIVDQGYQAAQQSA